MARFQFEKDLNKLNNDLANMGEMVTVAIENGLASLVRCDIDLAQSVMDGDARINEMEKSIESHCIKLLLRQQPVASDLLLISSALKMITDLERIGDQAADIAEIAIVYCETKTKDHTYDALREMGLVTMDMVHKAIRAFRDGDLAMADEVIATDDIVDDAFNRIRGMAIDHIKEGDDDPQNIIDILMIAKYLERIGDHAQNVAEWVVYSITGKHNAGARPQP